jgi:peptidoglycan/LPS O-acetylase OafA/YrhL
MSSLSVPVREPGEARSFYLPQLDGLRFVAFLAVFAAHAIHVSAVPPGEIPWTSLTWWARGAGLAGLFGVDLFFVLSGFLITALLLRERAARGRIDLWAFWVRRALRIWPLYYTYLAYCFVVAGTPLPVLAAFALFVGNWPGAVGPVSWGPLIGLMWSVQIEEQFYLAWPILLTLLSRRALTWVCLGAVLVSTVARIQVLSQGASFELAWFTTVTRLDSLALGALIALVPAARNLTARARRVMAVACPLILVAAVGVLANEVLRPAASTPAFLRPGVGYAAVASLVVLTAGLCCAGILLAALASPRSWLSHPWLVALGRISYGLYVVHLAALQAVGGPGHAATAVLAFGLTVAVAALSYRFIERPFLRLKGRFTHVRSSPPAGVVEPARDAYPSASGTIA